VDMGMDMGMDMDWDWDLCPTSLLSIKLRPTLNGGD
jgi:hypothetical protein